MKNGVSLSFKRLYSNRVLHIQTVFSSVRDSSCVDWLALGKFFSTGQETMPGQKTFLKTMMGTKKNRKSIILKCPIYFMSWEITRGRMTAIPVMSALQTSRKMSL